MSKNFIYFVLFFILTSFIFSHQILAQPKTISIEHIIRNPSSYEGVEVEFSGLVIQYVIDKGTTNYYLIKGDYGGIIRVNTAEPAPETNKKYRVRGIVYRDARNNTIFVSEKYKTLLSDVPTTLINPPQLPQTVNTEKDYSNLIIYGLLGLLLIFIVLFIYFQTTRRNLKSEYSYNVPFQSNVGTSNYESYRPSASREAVPEFTSDLDYKTIRIAKSKPPTLKYIPGKFVITDGADVGKEFQIAGYPTSNGYLVTIGRREVTGDKAYYHIHLKEKTVSREQAELYYRDNKLFIKNLSETNYTQVNGIDLLPGQIAEITPGTRIRTGEVEFKYILQ